MIHQALMTQIAFCESEFYTRYIFVFYKASMVTKVDDRFSSLIFSGSQSYTCVTIFCRGQYLNQYLSFIILQLVANDIYFVRNSNVEM